jgi:hypothetical protein
VVYPLALVALAEKYRFSSIGGTSAGAIAAAAAAAAEYGRQNGSGGFTRVAKIPAEVGPNLLALFQPTPALKPLYDIFIAALKAKTKLGETLCTQFDLDSHRWRRFLVAMARMEETLDEVASAYRGVPGAPENFADFLARYPQLSTHYRQKPETLAAMLGRGKELADGGVKWRAKPTIRDGDIPRPATNLRISPKP